MGDVHLDEAPLRVELHLCDDQFYDLRKKAVDDADEYGHRVQWDYTDSSLDVPGGDRQRQRQGRRERDGARERDDRDLGNEVFHILYTGRQQTHDSSLPHITHTLFNSRPTALPCSLPLLSTPSLPFLFHARLDFGRRFGH